MKRMALWLIVVLAIFMVVSCAEYRETWRGPAGTATPVCDPQPGVGYQVAGQEFIPVGYYTWRSTDGQSHREMVYVRRGKAGAK